MPRAPNATLVSDTKEKEKADQVPRAKRIWQAPDQASKSMRVSGGVQARDGMICRWCKWRGLVVDAT